jgi:hypothetical protein
MPFETAKREIKVFLPATRGIDLYQPDHAEAMPAVELTDVCALEYDL